MNFILLGKLTTVPDMQKQIYKNNSENRMSLLCSKAQDGVISGVERRQGRLFEEVGKEENKIVEKKKNKGTTTNLYWEVLLEFSKNRESRSHCKKKNIY